MTHSIQLTFSIELQPGSYKDLEDKMIELLHSLEDKLTSEYNHTVSAVSFSDWDLNVHPN